MKSIALSLLILLASTIGAQAAAEFFAALPLNTQHTLQALHPEQRRLLEAVGEEVRQGVVDHILPLINLMTWYQTQEGLLPGITEHWVTLLPDGREEIQRQYRSLKDMAEDSSTRLQALRNPTQDFAEQSTDTPTHELFTQYLELLNRTADAYTLRLLHLVNDSRFTGILP